MTKQQRLNGDCNNYGKNDLAQGRDLSETVAQKEGDQTYEGRAELIVDRTEVVVEMEDGDGAEDEDEAEDGACEMSAGLGRSKPFTNHVHRPPTLIVDGRCTWSY